MIKKLIKLLRYSTILTAFCGLLCLGCLVNEQRKVESVNASSVVNISRDGGVVLRALDSYKVFNGTADYQLRKYYDSSSQYYKFYYSLALYQTINYNSSTYKTTIDGTPLGFFEVEYLTQNITTDFASSYVSVASYVSRIIPAVITDSNNNPMLNVKYTFAFVYDTYGYTESFIYNLYLIDSNNSVVTSTSVYNDVISILNYSYPGQSSVNLLFSTNLLTSTDTSTTYNDGYNDGYNQGYENGYNIGSTDGYDNGYSVGYDDGVLSQEQAITDAYNAGYSAGYTEGFESDSTASTIFSGILQIAMVPINFFLAIFNFEILGINLSGFIRALFTIAITIIVVRTIFGGKGANDE